MQTMGMLIWVQLFLMLQLTTDVGADAVDAGVDGYRVRLTFDADVRYTRVKLDGDWLRNYMMHHMVKRERDWAGDQCLMVAILETLTPFHRWTNNWMCKYFHYHYYCQLCCCESLVNYFVQIHRDRRQQLDQNKNHNRNRSSAMRIAVILYGLDTTNNQYTMQQRTLAVIVATKGKFKKLIRKPY